VFHWRRNIQTLPGAPKCLVTPLPIIRLFLSPTFLLQHLHIDNQLIEPFVLKGRLTADLHFPQDELPFFFKYVPLHTRSIMWLQHGSAPPHFGLKVTQQLSQCYGNRWIGRGDPHAWPPRSPEVADTRRTLYCASWTSEVCTGRNFRISPGPARGAFGPSPKFVFKYVTRPHLSPTPFYSSPNEVRSIYNLP
jgi:hypothetical protein